MPGAPPKSTTGCWFVQNDIELILLLNSVAFSFHLTVVKNYQFKFNSCFWKKLNSTKKINYFRWKTLVKVSQQAYVKSIISYLWPVGKTDSDAPVDGQGAETISAELLAHRQDERPQATDEIRHNLNVNAVHHQDGVQVSTYSNANISYGNHDEIDAETNASETRTRHDCDNEGISGEV